MQQLGRRLVQNLNYNLDFGILEDVYNTPTWSKLMSEGESGKTLDGSTIIKPHEKAGVGIV